MSFAKAQDLIRLARLAATRRTGIGLDEICEEFDISHRTAQRMTDALETVFANVEVMDGPDRRRRWRVADTMLDRLEDSATRQRRFVSDASHELRSPVAAIRTELEVSLLHPEGTDWEEVARNVLAEDERLGLIVADLLTLARSDEQASSRAAAAAPLLSVAAR